MGNQQPGLELDQKLPFQEKAWRVERIGWGVLTLIALLALLGLFGTGPLSSAVAGSDDEGLLVDYERFIRHTGEVSLEIEVAPQYLTDGQVELWVSTDYIDGFLIESVSPQPDEVRAEGDRQVYVFLAESPDAPASVTFSLRADRIGRYSGEAGIVDGPTVSFTQLSYP